MLETEYKMNDAPFRVTSKAFDGLSLMWYSDAVFSGGGTMSREAAVLGVKSYSIFRGKLGAADEKLAKQGRLTMLTSPEQIADLQFVKRSAAEGRVSNPGTQQFIVDEILRWAGYKCGSAALRAEQCQAEARNNRAAELTSPRH